MNVKIKKKFSAKFKLENFLSGTSQISKIGHLVSILQCIKQRYNFLTHPVHIFNIFWIKYFEVSDFVI